MDETGHVIPYWEIPTPMTPYTPSDAEIEAALKAFYGTDKYSDALQERAFMRAALIAAATARNEKGT